MVSVKGREAADEAVDGAARHPTRARQVAATRAVIVEAADALMRRDGYVATSIAAIAAEAGVAVQTVYNAVGSKRDVLDAVLDRAATGPEGAPSVPELMAKRVASAGTAADVVRVLADWFAEVHPRVLPILQLIRQADAVDDAARPLEAARSTQRRRNYELAAEALLERGARRQSPRHIAATIWSVGHPQAYAQLVLEEGWPVAEYRDWVEATLAAALLGDGDAAGR